MKFTSSHIIQTVLFIPLAILTSCRDVPNDIIPELLLLDALNPPAYSLGGPVAELYGSETTLTNRISPAQISFKKGRSENLPLEAGAGEYTFKSPIYTGESYEVSVTDHPRSPTQFCSLENASGKIDNKSRDNVSTFCEGAYRVTTNLTGLKGSGLVLTSTAGDTIEVEADGAIEMPTPFVLSASYEVTVDTNPTKPWQTCRFTGEKVTVTGANESENDLTIDALTCVTNEYPITANISGLVNSGLFLTLNGTDVEVPAGSNSFVLGNVVSGVDYTVTLASNAVGQECSVFGGKGSITDKGQSIEVSCTQNGYMVGGGLDNYNGSGLTVKLSGSHSETKEIDAGRTGYYFNSTFNHNDTYSIAITAQPTSPWQTCSITQNGSGKILASTGSVADADISCTTNQYGLSGSISGLSFAGLVLDVNGSEFPISAASTSASLGEWDSGTDYTVTVATQPSFQTCTVAKGTGTVAGADIASVSVSCVNNPFPVGGKVSGLVGSDTVTIKNNGGSAITLSNGTHTYYEITYADTYSITAAPTVHATGYTGCVVANQNGSVGGPITNVNIVCTPKSLELKVEVTEGTDLLTDGNALGVIGAVSGSIDSSSTDLSSTVTYGAHYSITLSPPDYVTCAVNNGVALSGTMPSTSLNINLTCTEPTYTLNVNVTGHPGNLVADPNLEILNVITNTSTIFNDSGTTTLQVNGVSAGDSYGLTIDNHPTGVVCGFKEMQFGILAGETTLHINCVPGYATSQGVNDAPPAPLDFQMYQGKNTTVIPQGSPANVSYSRGITVYDGNLYIADTSNKRIIKTDTDGNKSYLDLSGISPAIDSPRHPVSDGTNLYFSDFTTDRIVKYNLESNTIQGAYEVSDHCDGPSGLALMPGTSKLYMACYSDNEITMLNLSTGIAGEITLGAISQPTSLVLLNQSLFVTNEGTHTIVQINLSDSSYSVLNGEASGSGFQDGELSKALFNNPEGITTDGANNLYVTERMSHRLRRIDLKNEIVSTIAGNGKVYTAGGVGAQISFQYPSSVATDGRSLYLADAVSVRKITDNGLVGYWPLNGTAKDYASDVEVPEEGSLHGNVAHNSTPDRYGNADAATSFDGVSGDYISAPQTNLPTGNAPRTLCAWFNPGDMTGSREIASYGSANLRAGFGIMFEEDGAGIKAKVHVFNDDIEAKSAPISINVWAHMCGSYDGTYVSLYLNGKLLAREERIGVSKLNTGTSNLFIGRWVGGTQMYFKGSISDVRVYSRALSEGEIHELAQDANLDQDNDGNTDPGYSTGATGLLSHYSFDDEGAGNPTMKDGGALGYTLTGSNYQPETGKDGDTGGAVTFNGTSAYMTADSTAGLPVSSHPRTLCTWVKPAAMPASNSNAIFFSYGKESNNAAFALGMRNVSGSMQLRFFEGSSSDNSINRTLPLNTWSHLCVSYDASNVLRLYVNGSEADSFDRSGSKLATATGSKLYLAAYLSGTPSYKGVMDDVRIYNTALTGDQIRQLAVQVPAGLVAAYDFTKGDGSNPLFDISGWGNMLTEINGPDIGIGRFGSPDTAYSFDGSTQYQYLKTATPPTSLPTGGNSRTMCAWVRDTGGDENDTVLAYGSNGDENGKISGLYMNEQEPGLHGNDADLPAGYVANLNVWNHICGIYNESPTSGESMVYVNGALTAQGTPPEGWNTPYNTDLYIGNLLSAVDWNFHGEIDDVAIWNRALTPEEIQALVRQPNKTIGVTTGAFRGNMEKCMNPPTCSTWESLGEVGTLEADWRCKEEFDSGFKAMLVDGTDRVACTSGNCTTSGIKEHIDWVLRPGITYVNAEGEAVFTADWNGVWDFSGGDWTNSVDGSGYAWTGLKGDPNAEWVTTDNCSSWASTGSYGSYGAIATKDIYTIVKGSDICSVSHSLYCVEQ